MFGIARLERQIRDAPATVGICDRIQQALTNFCTGEPAHDDIALFQLRCDPSVSSEDRRDLTKPLNDNPSRNWHIELSLEADALHRVDPLPTLMRTLTDVQDLAQHAQTIFTILAELVTNAIDHGLLGLDSALKATPDGFMKYYEQRDKLLAELRNGALRVHLAHDRKESGGRLAIKVEDSGPGFDFHAILPSMDTNQQYSGRGIPLLRSLCKSLTYYGNGNSVEAVYVWS